MKKYISIIFYLLIFILLFTASSLALTSSSASLLTIYDYQSLLSDYLAPADWQLEYLKPLDPGELKKGDYRFSPIVARLSLTSENIISDNDNSTMVYGAVFDTALSDDLTIHGKYFYQPWTEDNYNNEDRSNLLDLFVNYQVKEDNTLYFGYNRTLGKTKSYDSNNLLDRESETITNFFYLGYEMRGSFGFDD